MTEQKNTEPINQEEEWDLDEELPLHVKLRLQLQRVPWWAVILVVGIIVSGVVMYNNEDQREIMSWLVDDPEATTNDFFQTTYDIESEGIVLREFLTVQDISGERFTVPHSQLIGEPEEGILECENVDSTSGTCLDPLQTIARIQSLNVSEGATPDGFLEAEGVVEGQLPTGQLRVRLPDGSSDLVAEDQVTATDEDVLVCERETLPVCNPERVTLASYRLPYVERRVLLLRDEIEIRYLRDGFVDTIRRNEVIDFFTTAPDCVEGAPEDCAEIDIQAVRFPEKVTGTEVEIADDFVRMRTVEQQLVEVDRSRIIPPIEMGTVTCSAERLEVDPHCQPYEGTILNVEGEIFSGVLSGDTANELKIILDGENTASSFRKDRIISQSRQPDGCRYDDEAECRIEIQMEGETIAGRIEEETDTTLIIETVPERIVKIDRDDILNQISRRPATCAINNPRGCNAGIWLTILVTVSAYGLAVILGLIFGLMRVSSNPILYHISTLYVELMRGVPLLVILLYFAYVVGPQMRDATGVLSFLASFHDSISGVERAILGEESFLGEAILGLAIGYGAFLAEVFRAGIQSISKGQMEAARSLGMSYTEAMRHVILPQAIRVVLPPLGNNFIAMLKDSALISVLALPDLLQQGRLFIARTFQPIPVYNAVALYYIVLTLMLSLLVRQIERRSKLP